MSQKFQQFHGLCEQNLVSLNLFLLGFEGLYLFEQHHRSMAQYQQAAFSVKTKHCGGSLQPEPLPRGLSSDVNRQRSRGRPIAPASLQKRQLLGVLCLRMSISVPLGACVITGEFLELLIRTCCTHCLWV